MRKDATPRRGIALHSDAEGADDGSVPVHGFRPLIRVTTRRTSDGPRTTVTVDQLIPDSVSGRAARWRISTRPARLPAGTFDNPAEVNARFREGRAIACIDLASNTTVAGVAYHLDEAGALPVLLLAVTVRTDPGWSDVGRGCVMILKAYLHALGRRLSRHGAVATIVPERDAELYQEAYGFRRARVPAVWRRSAAGRAYLEQPPSD